MKVEFETLELELNDLIGIFKGEEKQINGRRFLIKDHLNELQNKLRKFQKTDLQMTNVQF